MRPSRTSKLLLAAALTVSALAFAAPLATADAVYHSQHIELVPVGASPLESGFVENIHPNGTEIYAHELYVLNGAEPSRTYQVTLHIFGDTACSGVLAALPTAQLVTNANGNAAADIALTPAAVGPLRGSTLGVFWRVVSATSSYRTACSTVVLD